ncbi:MAG: CPBP family intramembrane metalloprotease [Ruminococcaceae bacterium]|nr:CPBP family intramembrane metalloprotease [Oscillospiraceae bacterium]
MKKPTKRAVCLTIAIAGMIVLFAYEVLGLEGKLLSWLDESSRYLVSMTVTRLIGGAIFLSMVINLGYRVLDPIKKPFWRSVLICLPAFAVAINNFPFSRLISGGAVIDSPAWKIALLAMECLCVAFFEEMAFRGVVLLGLIGRRAKDRLWVFVSVVLSSVIFGLIHLINLYNSDPIAVILQIGYSTLIGAMCSVVLIKTANIWLCVALHGVFNFGGAVVQYCGRGEIWDTFTVILTAIIAVATTVYMIFAFLRADLSVFDGVYGIKAANNDKEIDSREGYAL